MPAIFILLWYYFLGQYMGVNLAIFVLRLHMTLVVVIKRLITPSTGALSHFIALTIILIMARLLNSSRTGAACNLWLLTELTIKSTVGV